MFIIDCPVHNKMLLAEKEKVTDETGKKELIFFCQECDCYYISTNKEPLNNQIMNTFKGKNVCYTCNPIGCVFF